MTLAAALVGLTTSASAAPPVVVIVDAQPEKLPAPHASTDLAAQVQEGLVSAGCSVPRICRGGDCSSAAVAKASHLLNFTGRYEARRFACNLSLEARSATTNVVEYRASTTNPVCPVTQLINDAREAGRRTCEELRRFAERAAPTAVAPAATVPPPVETTTLATPPPPRPTSREDSPSLSRRLIGPALMAAGAGAGAVGVYQLREKDDLTRCQDNGLGDTVCTHTKKRPLALPLLLVGAAAFGVGAWDLVSVMMSGDGTTALITTRGTF
ncbi:MAG TPA: hypothetical protein VGF45_13495 [Polyangia bacterium]